MKDILLIRKIAWSFEATTNVDFDELFCEAALGYLEAIKKYDPTKGKLSAFIWRCMDNQLKLYLLREEKNKPKNIPTQDCLPFEDMIENFPKETFPIIDIVTKNQDRFEIMSPTSSRKEIMQTLREQGWSWPAIWSGIRKLKLSLN